MAVSRRVTREVSSNAWAASYRSGERCRWLRVLLTCALVGVLVLGWLDYSTYRPQRELLACWRAETEDSEDEESTGTYPTPWAQRRAETLATLRRHPAVLLPFAVKCLEPRGTRLRETVNEWLDQVPFVTWRVPLPPDGSELAAQCLCDLGPEALPVLPGLEGKLQRPETAERATRVLAALGAKALPALQRGMESQAPDVQVAALCGLGEMEALEKDSLFPQVHHALRSMNLVGQAAAAAAVGSFCGVRSEVLPQLASPLRSAQEVPLAAGAAFGLSGLGDEGVARAARCLRDSHEPAGMGGEASTNLLQRLAQYPSPSVRERAQAILTPR